MCHVCNQQARPGQTTKRHERGDPGVGRLFQPMPDTNLDLAVLGDELHVERSSDIQRLRHLVRDLFDLRDLPIAERLRRQHEGRVTRVHAYVTTNCIRKY